MLTLELPATEDYPAARVRLEHSLSSLSKWESIYEKPFFGKDAKTQEETLGYMDLMVVDENPPEDYLRRIVLAPEASNIVNAYINSKQTGTTFRQSSERPSNEVITAELIYYWMIGFQIPFECDKWHLNKLMTLIKVCGLKQSKPKKMSKAEQAAQMRELNARRRAEQGHNG